MSQRRVLLHEALSLGKKELNYLIDGDVLNAEKTAHSREKLIDAALNNLDQENLAQLSDELHDMKNLHGRITEQAKTLRASLRQNLLNMRAQNKRISGYSVGAGNTPASTRRHRFISKVG